MGERRWLVGPRGAAAAALLAIAGVVVLVAALVAALLGPYGGAAADLRPPAPATTTATSPAPSASPARVESRRERGSSPADRVSGPLLPESAPVRVRIPAIGIDTRLVGLGLAEGGAMEVPADPGDTGWYTRGPTPGALGPAVLAAHVTWNRVPAAFFRLGELGAGDRVEVLRADGRLAVFEVRRVASFAKSRFPRRQVFGPTDHAALRLITCAGRYDVDRAAYDDNLVVFATLVDVRRPRLSGR